MSFHDPFEHEGLVLNVLTRTSNRPNRFRRCRESILAQEWGGTTRHIVSIDRPCTYAEGDIIVPATGKISPDVPPEHERHRDAPYNLYVNDLLTAVKGGWVFVLDDDDEFFTRDALAKLEPYMSDEDNFIVFKFSMGIGDGSRDVIMPTEFGRGLRVNDVACSCYVYHSKHKDRGLWHRKYAGDFFAVQNLARGLNIVWVDEVIAGTQRGPSQGSMEPLKYTPWKPRTKRRKKKELLSIIIPVCNQSRWTKSILEQISQTVHMPHEVIVVDNGSTDDTPEVTKGVKVIRNKSNLGVYKAWNQGCKAARGTHFAVLNNDLKLPDGWAERLLEEGRHVICPSYEQSSRERSDFERRNGILRERVSDVREADRPGHHPTGFAGFCFILTREAYERTGPFDESYRYWYGDNDYFLRLGQVGLEPVMCYNVLVHHYTNKTCMDMPDFKTQREEERKIFLRKWPEGVPLREGENV